MKAKKKPKSKKELYVVTGVLAVWVLAIAIVIYHLHSTSQPVSSSQQISSSSSVNPSISAKMICTRKTKLEIGTAIGVYAKSVSTTLWDVNNHLYSCHYFYTQGAEITLSVRALSNATDTLAYYNRLAKAYGNKLPMNIGQGAFYTNNGSVVVRKDFKVLFVDVAKLPEHFGPTINIDHTAPSRMTIAGSIAAAILNCWNGD